MTICGESSRGSSTSSPWTGLRTRIDASLYEIDPLGVVRSAQRARRGERRAVCGREPDRRSCAGGGHRHGRRGAWARAGRRSEPASSPGDLDRQRPRGGRAGRRARRAQCAARADGAAARAGHRQFRRHDGRGDDRASTRPGRGRCKYGSTGDQVDRLRVVFAARRGGRRRLRALARLTSRSRRISRTWWFASSRRSIRNSEGRLAQECLARRATAPAMRSRGPPARREFIWEGCWRARKGRWRVTLQAVLRTVPIPAARRVVLLAFAGLLDAAAFVERAAGPSLGASSCDLFDRRSLSLARDADASFRGWIDESAEAVLTVEFEGDDPDVDRRQAAPSEGDGAPDRAWLVSEPFATVEAGGVRTAAGPAPAGRAAADAVSRPGAADLDRRRRGGAARPVSSPCCSGSRACSSSKTSPGRSTPAPATGRLRLRPFLDLSDPGDRAKLEPLAAGVYDIVLEAGGTIGSAQACGLARTQFLRKQYGELVAGLPRDQGCLRPAGPVQSGQGHRRRSAPDAQQPEAMAGATARSAVATERRRSVRGAAARVAAEPPPGCASRATACPDASGRGAGGSAGDSARPALAGLVADRDGVPTARAAAPAARSTRRRGCARASAPCGRGGLAPVAGQPDPRDRHRADRSAALGRR